MQVLSDSGGVLDDGCWTGWRVACARRLQERSLAGERWVALLHAGQPGQRTKVPSGRKPPSVTTRWRWGCQLDSEPWVWRSGSPVVGIPLAVLIDIRYY